VAPSNVWRHALAPFQPGRCRVVDDPARQAAIFALIAAKYGIHWTMATAGKRLRGELKHRRAIEVDVEPRSLLAADIAVLQAHDVRKSYARGVDTGPSPGICALGGVSLQVAAGEILAIMGPSGSGKSTLLSLLGALDHATSGEIAIGGVCLSNLNDSGRAKLRRERIGFVFQFFNLLPLLSARDNVALPLLVGGMPRVAAEQRADVLLARVGLAARARHRPDELSGGEMQRVAVARALGPRPALLLADEPTGNLDRATGESLLTLLRTVAREDHCAIVMVTHDARAAATADRVLELRDGLVVDGDAQLARATPEVHA
jgi:putative ABC transport system ATP-binding protein